MKRITLVVVAIAVGVFTSSAAAAPGASGTARRDAATKTSWTATYDASGYYGEVKCSGTTIVSKKYPEGKDVEICEAVGGTLANMKAGKDQKTFANSEGGTVGEWESDSGSGKKTTDFSYNVNKKLTKFKLIAIY